ncbi:right-handed parallel beta-helix repeat-containing protein [Candidatus Electronema sp. JM]|uniref:right-handed parallel beta-helix repeat-containing protein n=1 Tax=Candidatus Electronema sp. JM TaxID=3401571 RepID=UPI003AA86DC3
MKQKNDMNRTALAFMSYVNEDDRHDNGWMTQFRERLSGEVRIHTGEPFDIFQDRKDIAWGQQWQERINQSLDAVTFLIPILTPAFFKSTACRDELERFLKREEALGRGDLILPVYYVNCPVLQDKAKREQDELAKTIAARQYADWRDLRFEDFTSSQLRKALAKMAQQIMAALERSQTETSRQQPEKESEKPSSTANTFQSSGGTQSIAQGSNAIGTQINNYYAPPPQESKPQPAPAVKTEPPTVVVDARYRADYTKINKAIKAVEPGTRILVRPGLYKEGIVIDKPVEIIGDGERSEIVIEAYGKEAIVCLADMGRVANLTLRQLDGENDCLVIGGGKFTLEDCDVSSQGSSNCVAIERCIGSHSLSHPDAYIRRCCIHGGKIGVFVRLSSKGTLEDNSIFANTLAGVAIVITYNVIMRRNKIYQNSGCGIWIFADGGGIFEDNDLSGNAEGAWEIEPDCEANVQRRGNKE